MKVLVFFLSLLSLPVLAQVNPVIPLRPGMSGIYYDYNSGQDVEVRCVGHVTPPPPVHQTVVMMTCDPYTNLLIDLYDRDGNKKASAKYFLSSDARCQAEKSRISSNLHNNRLVRPETVAFCDAYTNMIKINLSASGVREIEKTFMSSDGRCDREADDFNRNF